MSRKVRLRSRIAVRLTATVACALAGVISLVGVRLVMTEEEDLRSAVVSEMLLLTRSVEVSFENAIRDRQLADVQETLTELEAIDPRIDIYVLGAEDKIIAQSRGAAGPPRVVSDGEVYFVSAPTGPLAATHVPLSGPLPGIHGLLVARPLDDLERDLEHTRQQILLAAAASIVATALLLLVLSRHFVEQPLAQMVDAMRRFREDGSVALLGPFRDDEVGKALEEFAGLTAELRSARERLELEHQARAALEGHLQRLDKLATVGQLSAGLAHEVGSPLQVLEGRLSALKRQLTDLPSATKLLDIALEQTQRITRVVSQLLAFARPARVAPSEIDPTAPAERVLDFLELEARRRGVELVRDFSAAPRQVFVDPDHISQIVLNLLRNALEAVPSGGRVRVAMHEDPAAAALVLTVEDTGRGIAADAQEQIFEPFFTTRGDRGGTGLGLAVVRSLAERYGGRVSVASHEGKGTCFTVHIPLQLESPNQDRRFAESQ